MLIWDFSLRKISRYECTNSRKLKHAYATSKCTIVATAYTCAYSRLVNKSYFSRRISFSRLKNSYPTWHYCKRSQVESSNFLKNLCGIPFFWECSIQEVKNQGTLIAVWILKIKELLWPNKTFFPLNFCLPYSILISRIVFTHINLK